MLIENSQKDFFIFERNGNFVVNLEFIKKRKTKIQEIINFHEAKKRHIKQNNLRNNHKKKKKICVKEFFFRFSFAV